jgi:hypothetical protein
MAKLKFDKTEDSAIFNVENGVEKVIFYIDNIHPDVIETVVEMYNDDFSLSKIKDKLLTVASQSSKITTDEVDFLIEELTIFDDTVSTTTAIPTVTEAKIVTETKKEEVMSEPTTTSTTSAPQPPVQFELLDKGGIDAKEPEAEEKVRKQRKPRLTTGTEAASIPKKRYNSLSPEELIAQYQEKISLTTALAQFKLPQIEQELSTAGNKLINKFKAAYENLIKETLVEIQDL